MDLNGGTIDGVTIGGASAAAATVTTLNATGGGALTGTWSDLGTVTTVDINGGTADNVVIGGAVAAAGTFTTLNATGGGSLTGTWSDLGTVTTIDINGGTVDGTVVGGTTPAAATFTTLNATGGGSLTGTWSNLGTVTTMDLNGGTADNVVIGGAVAAAGTFTTLNATGGGALTGTWTDLGTVTTVDLNGGTIDGTIVGGASAAAGTFTTLRATSLGVGGVAANYAVTAYGASFGIVQVVNAATGSAGGDGSYFGVLNDTNLRVWNLEAAAIQFGTNGIERARIDSSGNLLIGTTTVAIGSPAPSFTSTGYISAIRAGTTFFQAIDTSQAVDETIWRFGTQGASFKIGTINDAYSAATTPYEITRTGNAATAHIWTVGASERARIDSIGNVFISKTASSISTPGHELNASGEARHTRDGDNVVGINRLTNDGDLVRFFQASTQEGSISVSGTTVSYNAFAGSHWSRFENGATPEVLVGTLIESTGEQLTWPGEADEKHTFGRICNTVQSRAVAGVFMAYDTDDEHGDFYCTAVGRYLMRVEAGENPQVGDLLEANGKYARVSSEQTDIKTYHVARVMGTSGSNHAADGSFCVAVELMIGG
jgi:hypothetical protein